MDDEFPLPIASLYESIKVSCGKDFASLSRAQAGDNLILCACRRHLRA